MSIMIMYLVISAARKDTLLGTVGKRLGDRPIASFKLTLGLNHNVDLTGRRPRYPKFQSLLRIIRDDNPIESGNSAFLLVITYIGASRKIPSLGNCEEVEHQSK
jgi:hypothetical protein